MRHSVQLDHTQRLKAFVIARKYRGTRTGRCKVDLETSEGETKVKNYNDFTIDKVQAT